MTVSVAQLVARQIRLWEVLKAERETVPVEPARRPAITISREAGLEPAELARRMAARLDYSVWDHEIIDFVASTVGVRRQLIESLEQLRQSTVERWVDGALRGHLVDGTDYGRALVHVLRVLGEQGGVVVLGRGASFVLAPEWTVRVRLVAPLDWRAERARQQDETADQCAERLGTIDRQRVEFVKQTVKSDLRDPHAYDLVINAESVSIASQERLILEALHARF